ncbi:hypothetical protein BKA62DRAFT_789703 [Auriculariales sp. MPI-PUGE-AT-0066]|nr:hypothetical protein BKA62DRAFT_789703 [Auriculariales sp. MPI-PUGE-AT-0066]
MTNQARELDVDISERNVVPALPYDPTLRPSSLTDIISVSPTLPLSPQPVSQASPLDAAAPPVLLAVAPTDAPSSGRGIVAGALFCIFLVYIIILGCYGVWLYFDILSGLYPHRYRFINPNPPHWNAYRTFTIIFGIVCGVLGLCVWSALLGLIPDLFRAAPKAFLPLKWTTQLIVFCAFPALAFTSPFAILIFTSPVQRHEYNHACDAWPLQAVLNANRLASSSSMLSNATFCTTGRGSKPLFTYNLDRGNNTFYLDPTDRDALGQAGQTPFLQFISYDKQDYTVTHDSRTETKFNYTMTGICHNDTECLRGAYDPEAMRYDLQYDLTVHSTVQSQDNITFNSSNDADKHEHTILRRALKADCATLKVCLTRSEVADRDGAVGPDVLVPLGLILAEHAAHACH